MGLKDTSKNMHWPDFFGPPGIYVSASCVYFSCTVIDSLLLCLIGVFLSSLLSLALYQSTVHYSPLYFIIKSVHVLIQSFVKHQSVTNVSLFIFKHYLAEFYAGSSI